MAPFAIRLKDRRVPDCTLQPVILKLDPGSHTTGIALARVATTEAGEVQHAVHLAYLAHRGDAVKQALQQRSGYRRRRRSANLRYRPARFLNRHRPIGWLPPSLHSRLGNVVTWAKRYQRHAPVTRIEVERVRFDMALMRNPEVEGVAFQQGELAGWEVRAHLLEKFQRRCAYCGKQNVPFELDHVLPRSRDGSDRVSNLVLACHDCNREKGDRTAAEWGHPNVEAQAKGPLRAAAAVNATRFAICDALRTVGLPLRTWSGGRTRWNRDRLGLAKDHALDALCVGDPAGVHPGRGRMLQIQATGRGGYKRTNVNASGFARSYLPRQKRVQGYQTGDLVRAEVPSHLQTAGRHTGGRVAVRSTGRFRVGTVDGINATYCRLLQRADGYAYTYTLTPNYTPLKRNGLSSPV
jgi:5-methylcytosine-specific restriction endonuclease McrA